MDLSMSLLFIVCSLNTPFFPIHQKPTLPNLIYFSGNARLVILLISIHLECFVFLYVCLFVTKLSHLVISKKLIGIKFPP